MEVLNYHQEHILLVIIATGIIEQCTVIDWLLTDNKLVMGRAHISLQIYRILIVTPCVLSPSTTGLEMHYVVCTYLRLKVSGSAKHLAMSTSPNS